MRFKKIGAALLACAMCFGVFSTTAFAYVDESAATEEPAVEEKVPEKEPEEPMLPLTPDGNLTLVDDAGSPTKSGKQFITAVTKNGNYFYIIIDRDDKGEETVHFLNQVDEADLLKLMDEEEVAEVTKPVEETKPEVVETVPEATEPTPEEKPKSMNMLPAILTLLVLACGGGFFVFKKVQEKKKAQEAAKPDPDADYVDDDEDYGYDPEFEDDDIESVVSKLLAAADNDVERAEHGIIFIDEIDKIAKKRNANQRDVSGESVQQGMLKLLEGAEIEVPVGASSKNAMVPMTTVDTKNILFICGGAFPELEEVIKERLNKEASIGFKADLKDKYDKEENLLCKVTVEDVRKFGMIPEFLGRLPILFSLEALTEDMLVRILTEPKNAIVRQYKKLLAMDEVDLEFTEGALHAIAKQAKEKKVGARALRAIIEEFMLDIMYEIPKDDNIGKVTITEDYVEKKGGPLIEMRGVAALPEQEANA